MLTGSEEKIGGRLKLYGSLKHSLICNIILTWVALHHLRHPLQAPDLNDIVLRTSIANETGTSESYQLLILACRFLRQLHAECTCNLKGADELELYRSNCKHGLNDFFDLFGFQSNRRSYCPVMGLCASWACAHGT